MHVRRLARAKQFKDHPCDRNMNHRTERQDELRTVVEGGCNRMYTSSSAQLARPRAAPPAGMSSNTGVNRMRGTSGNNMVVVVECVVQARAAVCTQAHCEQGEPTLQPARRKHWLLAQRASNA